MGPLKRRYIIGGLAVLGAELAFFLVFVFSGLYNVAASKQHLDVTTGLLDIVRRSSVRTQSLGIEAPPLDDPGLVQLGALHYESGCAPCHGSPAQAASPLAAAMLPEPPSLTGAAEEWSDEELFWIILNGQKYTGMPAWLATRREDEVWPVVAFAKALPQLTEDHYRQMVAANDPAPFLSLEAAQTCVGCHGLPDGPQVHPRVPRLGGQSADYLARSLREFASGLRESGTMQLFAASLDEAEIERLAQFYAEGAWGKATSAAAGEPPPGDASSGAVIFARGLPEQDVPACASCHDGAKGERYPRLLGQSATYVAQQLRLWQQGLRDNSLHGVLMAPIAARLSPEQIEDVAAYIGAAGGES